MTSCSGKYKPYIVIIPARIIYIIRSSFQDKVYCILCFLIIPFICMSHLCPVINNFAGAFKNVYMKYISILFCLSCICNYQAWSCIVFPCYSYRPVSKITHFYIGGFDVRCIQSWCNTISINQSLLFGSYICKFKMVNINTGITYIRIIIGICFTIFVLIFWSFCVPFFLFSNYRFNI